MRLLLPLSLVFIVLASGCTTVLPWERGVLARGDMALVNNGMDEKMRKHIYFSKEASSSVESGGGGGCGCN